jgi:hypothetical protein
VVMSRILLDFIRYGLNNIFLSKKPHYYNNKCNNKQNMNCCAEMKGEVTDTPAKG